ncbi:MAG TPA: TerD family protein [Williamsia sp.]
MRDSSVRDMAKGSRTDLVDNRYVVRISTPGKSGLVDLAAVLLGDTGTVRTDDDFVFFNNPTAPGVALTADDSISVDLAMIPGDVHRILVTAGTEAQNTNFGAVQGLSVEVAGSSQQFRFAPPDLTTETVLQVVALYRRGPGWRIDAIGQGYSQGLAALAIEHGIAVDEPGAPEAAAPSPQHTQAAAAPAPPAQPPATSAPPVQPPAASAISFDKVKVALTKDSPSQIAKIDLRKAQGDTNWVLTVGLEWDGRGATYDNNGNVTKYGSGDLDVYFFCRNEVTNDYVVISGDKGHQGSLKEWPFMHHYGDSKGPGKGNKPATEQVRVIPNENGDLLVNIYQSVDNGGGAIDKFGRPRVAIRYGRAGKGGLPDADADEILVYVGNSKNSFWATVAHIDVQDGVLTVDGETRYSRIGSEKMPGLDSNSAWVRSPSDGPKGRSKKANKGLGLNKYSGKCPT